jgi:cytochrome c oxidase subunit 4
MSQEHHIVSWKVYVTNFCALTALMIATVWAAALDLGAMNLPIALAIALAKTVCIVLIFMNVKWGTHLAWIFAGAGFFWFLIMIAITIIDYTGFGSMYTTGLPGAQGLIGAP